MAATSTGQGRDAEDRGDTEDREDNLTTGQEGDRSEEEAAAGNTDDADEISYINVPKKVRR